MPSPDRNPRVEKKEGACETRGPEAGTRWRRLGTSAKAPEGIYLNEERRCEYDLHKWAYTFFGVHNFEEL